MGEPVVEHEDVRGRVQAFERVLPGMVPVGADHHGHAVQHAGQQHGLVPGETGTQKRALAPAYDADPASMAAVAPRQNRG